MTASQKDGGKVRGRKVMGLEKRKEKGIEGRKKGEESTGRGGKGK